MVMRPVFYGYGMGFYGLSVDYPEDAVRVWLIPNDWDLWECVAMSLLSEDEQIEILSYFVEVSSN